MLLPTTNAKVGKPPPELSVTTSLKVTVAKRVSLALRWLTVASMALAIAPVALLNIKLAIWGAKVSMLIDGVVPAAPLLPAASW